MPERRNTIVCTFEPASPKITAYEIHKWIHNTLRIPDQTVNMIQTDGIRRQVFIKLITNDCVQSLLSETGGVVKYKDQNGEMSTVAIAVAGLGTKEYGFQTSHPK
jgi:predicted sulfurtransferase